MKIILSESKLNKVVDRVFKKFYGDDLVMVDSDGDNYLVFLPKKILEELMSKDEHSKIPLVNISKIHRNAWGNLFFDETEILFDLISVFGVKENELDELILNYFREKYKTYFKKISYNISYDEMI